MIEYFKEAEDMFNSMNKDQLFFKNNSHGHFEDIIRELLIANDFSVSFSRDKNFDFIGSLDKKNFAIEIKYYRTERAQISLLNSAAAQLASKLLKRPRLNGMLIVSCSLESKIKTSLENRYGIVIADRANIFNWMHKAPELTERVVAILEATGTLVKEQHLDIHNLPYGNRLAIEKFPLPDARGTALSAQLKNLDKGSSTWRRYEDLLVEIIKYLFENDLHGWRRQNETDDGLNKFDYVCRVLPTTNFWKFLIDHLGSRYVLFEFKNYSDPIKQGQILTTEKYLFVNALRRVAIIFCREGADKGAIAMAQGAMREHGKLILVIDDEKIHQMLRMKELGEDPSDLLFEVADDFLLALSR